MASLAPPSARGYVPDVHNGWERFLGVDRPVVWRVALTLILGTLGFATALGAYRSTGHYFMSIVIVTVVLVSLLAGTRLALGHAVAVSIAADYFFIAPSGMVLASAASWEHFVIIAIIAIVLALAASSMRAAFRETIANRQHAERMLAIVSHDVRNPLATVRLAVSLAAQDASETRQRELHNMIIRNLDHADAMVQSLLDVASTRAGKSLPLSFCACDLAAEVRAIVADSRVGTSGRRIELVADEAIIGSWSGAGIRRALENLIGNAVKYGAPDAPIVVKLVRHGKHALLSVHNDGAPIAARDRKKIFRPFERAGVSAAVAGWGLGLALVGAIAKAHGGTISLESEPRAGTTFTLDLPIAS